MSLLPTATAARLPARCAVGIVRAYQRLLSGLKPPTCRYYPTCSEYAAQAILHRGLIRGCLLAGWRLLRCNPFSPGGYDPGPWTDGAAHRNCREGAPTGDAQSARARR
jgi:putative membrane protein insertion efficiency factor